MKIGGVDPRTLPNVETLVLPKGDKFLVFKARGLADMDEFAKLVPEPKPPGKLTKDGWVANPDDKNYQSVLTEYNRRRLAYMVVRSLAPSDIEWDTVEVNNPGTWCNWEKDLRDGGLSQTECNRVLALVIEANCLDEAKLQKAREVFLRGPLPGSDDSSLLPIEQATSPSGAPVAA